MTPATVHRQRRSDLNKDFHDVILCNFSGAAMESLVFSVTIPYVRTIALPKPLNELENTELGRVSLFYSS